MNTQEHIDFARIEQAIIFIRDHFKQQPSLEAIAASVHVSPSHFQRMFTDWAGTSPKKFLQYMSVEYAKNILQQNRHITLFDAAVETGLSSSSRLHDLFITIEGMTPAEYKNGAADLVIDYCYAATPFGSVIVASTAKGVCYMAFEENEKKALDDLKVHFPNAMFQNKLTIPQQNALFIFQKDWSQPAAIKLHLKATAFQLKVWEALLKIPMGQLSTYGELAAQTGSPGASRAVGTAIGKNPVAYLIPCHRVIQASGAIGGYMWGNSRKMAIIGWEAARAAN